MGVDMLYDFDEETKQSMNFQEHDDSIIIVWNKGNNTEAISQ